MDAMEKISQNQVDLAIVDLNMPNMDGFEFIETIRKTEDYKNLPIIILSSEKSEESIQKGRPSAPTAT
jgi:two-component system chemotaxis response regulator CheY